MQIKEGFDHLYMYGKWENCKWRWRQSNMIAISSRTPQESWSETGLSTTSLTVKKKKLLLIHVYIKIRLSDLKKTSMLHNFNQCCQQLKNQFTAYQSIIHLILIYTRDSRLGQTVRCTTRRQQHQLLISIAVIIVIILILIITHSTNNTVWSPADRQKLLQSFKDFSWILMKSSTENKLRSPLLSLAEADHQTTRAMRTSPLTVSFWPWRQLNGIPVCVDLNSSAVSFIWTRPCDLQQSFPSVGYHGLQARVVPPAHSSHLRRLGEVHVNKPGSWEDYNILRSRCLKCAIACGGAARFTLNMHEAAHVLGYQAFTEYWPSQPKIYNAHNKPWCSHYFLHCTDNIKIILIIIKITINTHINRWFLFNVSGKCHVELDKVNCY